MKKQILAALLVMGNLIAGCGGSDDVTETQKESNYTEWASLLQNSSKDDGQGNPIAVLKDGRTIIGYRDPQDEFFAIVVLLSSYSSNLKKFKISDDVTETQKENNYTEWTSLLQNSSKYDGQGNPTAVLKDSRTIIGYRSSQDEFSAIVALPSSYSSNLKEFKMSENPANNSLLITLNENIEDKPKAVFYLPNPGKLNKEEIQNRFQFISYTRNSENPVNIPIEVVHTPEDEYLLEFSLLGSGEYIFYAPPQQQ